MLLSACLIVKNESLTLRKCLESLEGVADEIIVVDTGSEDDTLEIASEFGAKIYTFEWDGDFSHARNESLRHASGDYILFIDADEYLDAQEKRELRSYLKSSDVHGVFVRIRNYIGDLRRFEAQPDVLVLRIFRRGYTFSGRIHEQIYNQIKDVGGTVVEFPLTIHHMGYLREFILGRNKIERNLVLEEQEMISNPDSVFHRASLMAEYLRMNDYRACIRVGEIVAERLSDLRDDSDEKPHYVRALSCLIHSYVLAGEVDNAFKVAREAALKFRGIVELQRRYANILLIMRNYRSAVDVLMECRRLGDPTLSFVDTTQGNGTYLAAADLALTWSRLGDDHLAKQWYLTSFSESPSLPYIVFSLLYLLPRDGAFLKNNIEVRIRDAVTYRHYVEAYLRLDIPGAEEVVKRYESKYDAQVDRIHLLLAIRNGRSDFERVSNQYNTPQSHLFRGILHLEDGDRLLADAELSASGDIGQRILKAYDVMTTGVGETEIEILPYIHDFIGLGTVKLLALWLRHAKDRDEAYVPIKHSPYAYVLESTEWQGVFDWECEQNVIRHFKNRELDKAIEWLEKAMEFAPTVTKVLLESDIALAYQNVEHVISLLRNARGYFQESQVLQNVIQQLGIGNVLNPISNIQSPLQLLEDANTMNPMDVYRNTSAQTMPLNIQLSKLHERGALLTQLIRELSATEKVNDMRKYIEEVQNIITFLRSSLDRTLEVSDVTDQTYAFIYRTMVKWYLQPSNVEEDYATVLEFWQSWAETWKKVQ